MHDPLRTLRRLVWLYFLLLLFEGALRKWIVPGLSNVLLIIRDPVVIAIYLVAAGKHVFPKSVLIVWIQVLGLLCFIVSFAGIGTLQVTIFGWRANFLHLPLILVLPQVLREEDLRRIGFVTLLVLPFMAGLALLQFRGGPDSSWNVGAGGTVGAQLYAAEGKVRASGTFSFVGGLSSYLALAAAFVMYGMLEKKTYPRWLIIAALPSLVLAVVVSASRTTVLSVGIVCATVIYIGLSRPLQYGKVVRPIILALVAVVAVAAYTPVFNEGMNVHKGRFEQTGGLKEGILVRTFTGFASGAGTLLTAPLLGYGLGVGTNAGARILTGEVQFSLGEGEWDRVISESGPILGGAYLLLRIALFLMALKIAFKAYQDGRALALIMAGAAGLNMLNAQFGQPTNLGFSVFVTGLILAAAKVDITTEAPTSLAEVPASRGMRGRSVYAEQLHGKSK